MESARIGAFVVDWNTRAELSCLVKTCIDGIDGRGDFIERVLRASRPRNRCFSAVDGDFAVEVDTLGDAI